MQLLDNGIFLAHFLYLMLNTWLLVVVVVVDLTLVEGAEGVDY
jgi:hypothetical protein